MGSDAKKAAREVCKRLALGCPACEAGVYCVDRDRIARALTAHAEAAVRRERERIRQGLANVPHGFVSWVLAQLLSEDTP